MARIFVATIFTFVVLFAELPKTLTINFEIGNYLCKKIPYVGPVRQIGDDGKVQCEGTVNHTICAGYCLSSQRPSLYFSTEKIQPVCQHTEKKISESKEIDWTYCKTGFNPKQYRMRINEPTECKCSICDSSSVSCQYLTKRKMNSLARFQPSFRKIYVPKPEAESNEEEEWAFKSPPSVYLI